MFTHRHEDLLMLISKSDTTKSKKPRRSLETILPTEENHEILYSVLRTERNLLQGRFFQLQLVGVEFLTIKPEAHGIDGHVAVSPFEQRREEGIVSHVVSGA